MKLTLARKEHGETVAAFYKSLHDETFPHPEMFEARNVSLMVEKEELAVVIASDGNAILGCGIGFPATWNQSFEIGALSVAEIEDRGAVGRALFEALRRLGLRTYGVSFFRANTEASFQRGREVGAACWGFRVRPGARTIDEAELIMGFFENRPDAMRVHPVENEIVDLPFSRRIVDALEGQDGEVPYPKNFPVGAPRGTGSTVISGRIWPTYHSNGNYVTIESSAGPYPMEIIREFVGKVRKKGVSDIRMALPVNHESALTELLGFGFQPCAYLPGWYLRGPHRFDCLEMVSGLPRIPRAADTFMQRAVKKIADGLKL